MLVMSLAWRTLAETHPRRHRKPRDARQSGDSICSKFEFRGISNEDNEPNEVLIQKEKETERNDIRPGVNHP